MTLCVYRNLSFTLLIMLKLFRFNGTKFCILDRLLAIDMFWCIWNQYINQIMHRNSPTNLRRLLVLQVIAEHYIIKHMNLRKNSAYMVKLLWHHVDDTEKILIFDLKIANKLIYLYSQLTKLILSLPIGWNNYTKYDSFLIEGIKS